MCLLYCPNLKEIHENIYLWVLEGRAEVRSRLSCWKPVAVLERSPHAGLWEPLSACVWDLVINCPGRLLLFSWNGMLLIQRQTNCEFRGREMEKNMSFKSKTENQLMSSNTGSRLCCWKSVQIPREVYVVSFENGSIPIWDTILTVHTYLLSQLWHTLISYLNYTCISENLFLGQL